MAIQQQYGLTFNKTTTSDGEVFAFVRATNEIGLNSRLSFLTLMDSNECNGFIYDLNRCINSQSNVDEGFFSDSVENISIVYAYPNIILDNSFTMPMQDMLILLQEWLAYIS